jgi:hypothetical protein
MPFFSANAENSDLVIGNNFRRYLNGIVPSFNVELCILSIPPVHGGEQAVSAFALRSFVFYCLKKSFSEIR